MTPYSWTAVQNLKGRVLVGSLIIVVVLALVGAAMTGAILVSPPSGWGPAHALSCATTGASRCPTWVNISSVAGGPSERNRAAMVYDPQDHYTLLFGGYVDNPGWEYYNDTWIFQNGHWTELFPPQSPGPRASPGIAYDSALGKVVLFGGVAYGIPFNDTWVFSAGNWTEVSTPQAPSARLAPAMAYDGASSSVVLFGGDFPPTLNVDVALGDTWEFAMNMTWVQLHPTNAPSPRFGASIAYDSGDGYPVLFGGVNLTSGQTFGDTWALEGSDWVQLAEATSAPPLSWGAMTSLPNGSVLMFGGQTVDGAINDTWEFSSGVWTQLNPTHSPPPRAAAALSCNAVGSPLLFGGRYIPSPGSYGPFFNDTWELSE